MKSRGKFLVLNSHAYQADNCQIVNNLLDNSPHINKKIYFHWFSLSLNPSDGTTGILPKKLSLENSIMTFYFYSTDNISKTHEKA